LVTFTGDSAVQTPYLQETWNLGAPAIAPGGRWVAYPSWERGSPEVLVESFPTPGARYQISSGGGYAPRWSADGRTLYYLRFSDGTLVAATVRLGSAVEVVEQRNVSDIPPISRSGAYDAHPDGERFVIVRRRAVSRSELIVALNWFSTLRERFRAAK
jgi:hypothetical protein